MASQSTYLQQAPSGQPSSGWATGVISFASLIMILTGGLQALAGLIAIFNDKFYAVTANYVFQFDATTWGWIHLIVGTVVFLAGFGVLFGWIWARAVGILLAVLSAIAAFLFVPYYPFFALLIVALDVLVIWALAAHDPRPDARAY